MQRIDAEMHLHNALGTRRYFTALNNTGGEPTTYTRCRWKLRYRLFIGVFYICELCFAGDWTCSRFRSLLYLWLISLLPRRNSAITCNWKIMRSLRPATPTSNLNSSEAYCLMMSYGEYDGWKWILFSVRYIFIVLSGVNFSVRFS